MSRLLITGGAGFIGSNFVKRALLHDSSLKITVIDLLTYAGNLENLSEVQSRIEFVHGDIRDRNLVRALVKDSDIVVNFAAESHNDNSLSSPDCFITTNVNGTHELLEAVRESKVRFHQVSTDEVFGDLPLRSKEKFHPESPYRPSSPYSASKAAADHLVRAWVRSFGIEATISNCSNNFGPNQHPEKLIPRTATLVANDIKPKVYGNGQNVRDWIHVDDHSDGVLSILDKGGSGETYLLGADSERTNLQVVQAILKILGKPESFIEFVEDRPGHDLRYAIDASKTINELGWKPRSGSFEDLLPLVVSSYVGKETNLSLLANPGPSLLVKTKNIQ